MYIAEQRHVLGHPFILDSEALPKKKRNIKGIRRTGACFFYQNMFCSEIWSMSHLKGFWTLEFDQIVGGQLWTPKVYCYFDLNHRLISENSQMFPIFWGSSSYCCARAKVAASVAAVPIPITPSPTWAFHYHSCLGCHRFPSLATGVWYTKSSSISCKMSVSTSSSLSISIFSMIDMT